MKKLAVLMVVLMAVPAMADVFGTGTNQFTIDFVNISKATNPTSGYGIVGYDYRMGTYEITNDQWNKFKNAYGTVYGNPTYAYDREPYYTGTNLPNNSVSWYETAQFVNWLNTSKGYQAAYKFTGTQGTSDYTLGVWDASLAAGGTNLFRHKDAHYFLPSENEWVKAAYWNGASLQTYATKAGETLFQGNGVSGTGWNYYDGDYVYNPYSPWNVGSGSQELNGTYDMMGNIWEWMESPYISGDFTSGSNRAIRGGSFSRYDYDLSSSYRFIDDFPSLEYSFVGFRVASVPEPCSMLLLAIGGMVLYNKKRK